MKFETVIGLEIHVELATKTKIFCNCENVFGGEENTHCCPVCLGLPGSLPVMNQSVVDYAARVGLALGCEVAPVSYMDRKNYHYPDLPKGYQISQRGVPICSGGQLNLVDEDGTPFTIGFTEIHMEEDAGKLVHLPKQAASRADYNRAAVPLIEIVTDPDFRSASQVCTFLQALRELLISLGVSDCKMQEGSMRCDVNLSLREEGSTEYGTRCEMKNLNSFRSVTRAIAYEARRQTELLEKGEKVIQQTLRWDDDLGKTYAMRDKEDSQDYRYFPEPDLPPIVISAEHMQELKDSLPELPQARSQRYEALGLASQEARLLANTAWMTTLMDGALTQKADAKIAANWLIGPMASLWNEHAAQEEPLPFTGEQYGAFVQLITGNKINSSGAKTVLEAMVETGKDPDAIVKEKNLAQMEDTDALLQVAKEVVAENQDTVEAYLGGREKAFASLIGAAMKKTRGKANPKVIRQLILDLIQK